LAPTTGTEERYTVAISALWDGLARTLSRLDSIASVPERLVDRDVLHALRRLQYALHLASEDAYGLRPPSGAASAHADLADALAGARDATAEVAEAVEELGAQAVDVLLHEWRGALFRVRLARLRLDAPPPPVPAAPQEPRAGIALPLVAFVLALGGALACAIGATVGLWQVWAAGLAAVCAALLAYRP
jgi:hypothetical protein